MFTSNDVVFEKSLLELFCLLNLTNGLLFIHELFTFSKPEIKIYALLSVTGLTFNYTPRELRYYVKTKRFVLSHHLLTKGCGDNGVNKRVVSRCHGGGGSGGWKSALK